MKCYNHPGTDAVGTCKNCSKGICAACLTDTGNGIACTATCVEEVNSINQMINKNKTAYGKAASTYNRNAIIYLAFAAVFLFIGFTDERMQSFMLPVGGIFVIGAIIMLANAAKYRK